MSPAYPEDCIQSLVRTWWTRDEAVALARGRLLRAFVPYVDQEPQEIVPRGRSDPRDHTRADYEIRPLRVGELARAPSLPVAGMPTYAGEVRAVYRGKVRPVIVVSAGGPEIPRELRRGAARWQSVPTVLVAPTFGAAQDGTRGGWRPEFVTRIRRLEYPQYIWDVLPIGGANESIIRLDHIQPISRDPDSFKLEPHRLSDEALTILDEQLSWLTTGELPEDGVLLGVREEFLKLP